MFIKFEMFGVLYCASNDTKVWVGSPSEPVSSDDTLILASIHKCVRMLIREMKVEYVMSSVEIHWVKIDALVLPG